VPSTVAPVSLQIRAPFLPENGRPSIPSASGVSSAPQPSSRCSELTQVGRSSRRSRLERRRSWIPATVDKRQSETARAGVRPQRTNRAPAGWPGACGRLACGRPAATGLRLVVVRLATGCSARWAYQWFSRIDALYAIIAEQPDGQANHDSRKPVQRAPQASRPQAPGQPPALVGRCGLNTSASCSL